MKNVILTSGVALFVAMAACGGSEPAVQGPVASASAETSASAPAPTTEPTAAPTATASAAAAPPAPPPLPEAFTKAEAPFAAAIAKLGDELKANEADCKKVAASLKAFTTSKDNDKVAQAYGAEAAKLAPEQRAKQEEGWKKTWAEKTTAAVEKCSKDAKSKKDVDAAVAVLMKWTGQEAPKAAEPAKADAKAAPAAPAKTDAKAAPAKTDAKAAPAAK